MNIFLVTSAIYSKIGRSGQLLPEKRIEQTIDTAKSIIKYVPDAKIYLLEGGSKTLDFRLRNEFLKYYTDIIDFTYHPFIAYAHEKINLDKQEITVIKGPCESHMLREACKLLSTVKCDRIFKISGRYCLSDEFDLDMHTKARGKYLMKTKDKCLSYYSDPSKNAYSPYQYSTRFYSFCGSLLNKVIINYDTINNRLLELYANSEYIDIEHMTYLVYNQQDIIETSPIGLAGSFAENPDWHIKE